MHELPSDILEHQIAYYRARASEYDEWFLRLGRYDRGADWNAAWFREVAELEALLAHVQPAGDVLELACGTGWWTERLARTAATLTAVDASPEVIALNRQRLAGRPVSYHQADLFAWAPPQQYDVVFFSFWLSHVPPERFAAFWALVGRALRPEGRVVFFDSYQAPPADGADAAESLLSHRELKDGRAYTIVKVFYQPEPLRRQLASLGWDVEVGRTAEHFLYGVGRRAPAD